MPGFVGIDLGGPRGKTTAVAWIETCGPALLVREVLPKTRDQAPWTDDQLVAFLSSALAQPLHIAINAPLTLPACARCRLPVCPGISECADPAVAWLRHHSHEARPQRPYLPTPYAQRCTEIVLCFDHKLLQRDRVGAARGAVALRAHHLVRRLAACGYRLHDRLWEVSVRASVTAWFGARVARAYRRDADPWTTRQWLLSQLPDLRFAPDSRFAREESLKSDHCLDALLAAYTCARGHGEGWQLPESDRSVFAQDGWIFCPRAPAT